MGPQAVGAWQAYPVTISPFLDHLESSNGILTDLALR